MANLPAPYRLLSMRTRTHGRDARATWHGHLAYFGERGIDLSLFARLSVHRGNEELTCPFSRALVSVGGPWRLNLNPDFSHARCRQAPQTSPEDAAPDGIAPGAA